MNSAPSKNESLLSMMPPQTQERVLLLIKRLGDQKQAKQQFQKKCSRYEAQINELHTEIQKLKKQNNSLKAKWQNSFSMISKVRQNFSGSKRSDEDDNQKSKNIKKLRFNKQQANWSQQSEEVQSQAILQSGKDKNTIGFMHQIRVNNHENVQPLVKSLQKFKRVNRVQNDKSQQKCHADVLPPLTGKKQRKNTFNQSQIDHQNYLQNSSRSKLNMTNRSNKKLEIECLKQQIEQLSEQIKTKQTGNMSLTQKVKRCEQIKNRYRKTTSGHNDQTEQNHLGNNNSTLLDNYQSPKKSQTTQNTQQQSYEKSFYDNSTKKKTQLQSLDSSKKLHKYYEPHSNENNYQSNKINQSKIQNLKQNFFTNNSIVSQTQNCQNKNPPKKNFVKPVQQSFYDDGLLDLIQEMNP